jgi:hypothetical protein
MAKDEKEDGKPRHRRRPESVDEVEAWAVAELDAYAERLASAEG